MSILYFRKDRGLLWAVCAFVLALGIQVIGLAAYATTVPFPILEPRDTVDIEHNDRKNRLVRLSDIQSISRPEFYEYVIAPEKHGLRDFGPMPVLRVVFRDRVFFDFNKYEIRPEAVAVIGIITNSLRLEPPDVTVFVAGHTDGIGSVNYNLQLGLRRSRAVASEMVARGVGKTQAYVVSFGKAVPIESNDTEDGRAQNRRVELLFSARPEPIAAWLAEQESNCAANMTQKGDNCPADVIRAESVDLKIQPTTIILSEKPSSQNTHASEVIINQTDALKSISFGSKVVNIDLRQKVFSFPPPEGRTR